MIWPISPFHSSNSAWPTFLTASILLLHVAGLGSHFWYCLFSLLYIASRSPPLKFTTLLNCSRALVNCFFAFACSSRAALTSSASRSRLL